MITVTDLFSFLYPLSAILTFILVIFGWINRKNPVSHPFILLMSATTIWTTGDYLITWTNHPDLNYLITAAIYPAVVTVPVAWFLVVLFYSGYDRYLSRRNICLLFLIPALNALLVATNPGHLLFYTSVVPESIGPFVIWHYNHGPLFLLTIIYSYFLVLFSFILITTRLLSPTDIYRHQTCVLFIASFVPFVCNVIYVINPESKPTIDLTPFSFALVGILIFFGIIRYQLFSTVPLAYSSLFASMHDAVVATDSCFRIIDLNPAAIRICKRSARDAIGIPIRDVLPEIVIPVTDTLIVKERRTEITLSIQGKPKHYEVTDFPLISNRKTAGWIFTIRDITERKKIQESLEIANKNLNLLSSITRHDILNQVTGLQGYLGFSVEENTNSKVAGYLKKSQEITRTIQQQIEFTGIYQDIGAGTPKWQNIQKIAERIRQDLSTVPDTFKVELHGIEIYADPLFEKVFFTLVENTIRHAEGVSEIRFSYQISGDILTLIYEDNGPGVPDEDKKRIFLKQFGKNTGFGLFLSKEILAITGMSIREEGMYGNGVRFLMDIPEGAWKKEADYQS